MRGKFLVILALACVGVADTALAVLPAVPTHPGMEPALLNNGKSAAAKKKKQGAYNVVVTGDYEGSGTARLTATSINITGSVKAAGGSAAAFRVTDVAVDEKGYFSGAGTIGGPGGKAFTISGRIDLPAGDDEEQDPKAKDTARISATFKCQDGSGGRIIGGQTERDP